MGNENEKPVSSDPLGTGLAPEADDDDWNDGEGEWVYYDAEKKEMVSFHRKKRSDDS